MNLKTLFVSFIVTYVLTGCSTSFVSIDSKQVSFLRQVLMTTKEQRPLPTWVGYWEGEPRSLYAVNAGSQILFANELGDLIRFQDGQIVEVRNLFPSGEVLTIIRNKASLEYKVGRNTVAEHTCSGWKTHDRMRRNPAITEVVQRCANNDFVYENSYSIDPEKRVIRLNFLIHPDYPPLILISNTGH